MDISLFLRTLIYSWKIWILNLKFVSIFSEKSHQMYINSIGQYSNTDIFVGNMVQHNMILHTTQRQKGYRNYTVNRLYSDKKGKTTMYCIQLSNKNSKSEIRHTKAKYMRCMCQAYFGEKWIKWFSLKQNEFQLGFSWSLFLPIQMILNQHWFR